ncbi:hypothetical protein [Rhodopila sp.]|uniref:hypothetical protein n=1 Tax=Rhodopila sp. TaxID=2480087 RepID=UPI002C06EBCD|nr:hypothetical protein [Rhodopila sp.]HVZ08975.1 hypothetical protein [Rhodopila sp.]
MPAPNAVPPNAVPETILAIVVSLLTPLFLGGATGNTDPAIARIAAVQALQGFHPRSTWEAFTALRILGFSMAAAASLNLSMGPGLSDTAARRWRSNANALQRSADRGQDRLDKHRSHPEEHPPEVDSDAEAAATHLAADINARIEAALAQLTVEVEGTQPAAATSGPVQAATACDAQPVSSTASAAPAGSGKSGVAPVAAGAATVAAASAATPAISGPHGRAAASRSAPTVLADGRQPIDPITLGEGIAAAATAFTGEMPYLPVSEQRRHQMRLNALTSVSLQQGPPFDPAAMPRFRLPATAEKRP